MSNVYFSADLHLGDSRYNEQRDEHIVHLMLKDTSKRDTLWLLGDVLVHKNGIPYLKQLTDRINVNVVLGNHDLAVKYFEDCNRVVGFIDYKGYLLSHCPIHPEHLRKAKGNIHGHLHTEEVPDSRYFNVNIDWTRGEYKGKVAFNKIKEHYKEI